jgi:hypothetical protein
MFPYERGAVVHMSSVAEAVEADALSTQRLADEPALSRGIHLALAVHLEHFGFVRIFPGGRLGIEASQAGLPELRRSSIIL